MRTKLVLIAVAAAATLAGPGSSAAPPWSKDVAQARRGLDMAEADGRLDPLEAAGYREILERSYGAVRRLPGTRATELGGVIEDVAVQWRAYSAPRARTLFTMLDVNTRYLASHQAPGAGRDVAGEDGIVYRAFPGHGLQFHPLANFAKLNGRVAAKRLDEASVLALALADRGVPRGDGLTWEYHFPFGGGRAPWTSGMAQAVGAQALARAGAQVGDPLFTQVARRAYRAVHAGLVRSLPQGPWVRLYSFSDLVVLNAHLQTIVSLGDYATLTGDVGGQALADQMLLAASALLPRFDTGYWSLYALGGRESTLDYHRFVILLLKRLAARSGNPFYADLAARFQRYETEPPLVRPGAPSPPAYPAPLDGFRDSARVSFWLSKMSRVTVQAGSGRRFLLLARGPNVVDVYPGRLQPGSYPVRLRVVDVVGNAADAELPPVVVQRDTLPPAVTARVVRSRLIWRGRDDASPWLRLTLRLTGGGRTRVVELGQKPFSGSLRLAVKPGIWRTTLVASDSSGNRTAVSLGVLVGRR